MCPSRNTWRIFWLASSFLISPSCSSLSGFCPPSFSPLNMHCSSYLPPQLRFYLSINLGPRFIQEFHKALSLQKSDPSPSQRVPNCVYSSSNNMNNHPLMVNNISVFLLEFKEKRHSLSLPLAPLLAPSLLLGFVNLCYIKARETFCIW